MKRGKIWDCRKTDGQSEAFESRKWKTKAIGKVGAKGRGLRGLHTGVGDSICGREELTRKSPCLQPGLFVCLSGGGVGGAKQW